MCNEWPVAQMLLSKASSTKSVAGPLWRFMLRSTLVDMPSSPTHNNPSNVTAGVKDEAASELVSLLPQSLKQTFEAESWDELAQCLDTACGHLQPGPGVPTACVTRVTSRRVIERPAPRPSLTSVYVIQMPQAAPTMTTVPVPTPHSSFRHF
jgi:hypothetical protein